MINVEYIGRTGNNLFQYCLGRIIAETLNYQLISKPIAGFNETYKKVNGKNNSNTKCDSLILKKHIIDLDSILKTKDNKNIFLKGYFQRYEYYKNYKDKIKLWLKPQNLLAISKNSLVVHVRRGDYVKLGYDLSFNHYEKMINCLKYDKLYIVTDNPNDPFFNKFNKYNPVIVCNNPLNDFNFMASFNKIIISPSSFSWWAAFLSSAEEIIYPITKKGIWGYESRPDIDLRVLDEKRYMYVEE